MKLKDKTVIVTGGVRDIGRAISVKLAREGACVVANYFDNEADAQQTRSLIEDFGGRVIVVQGDMTRKADVERLAEAAVKAFGPEIHGLVNVVGGLVARKSIAEMDEAFWDFLMNVNVKSCFLTTQAVAPHMVEGSAIVNFSSQAARDGGGPGASAYATAKGAVMTFTRSMAKELGPKGIRVNALAPGMINTSFHDRFTKDEVREKVAAGTPLRREGRADEVADLVTYLLGTESSFLTGTNIDIGGGLYFS
jgi:3-oxoacyl-[acyl-carrier protein] reductase